MNRYCLQYLFYIKNQNILSMKNNTKILIIAMFLGAFILPAKSQPVHVNLNIAQPGVVNCLTGIETNFSAESVRLFPNPTHDIISIQLKNLKDFGSLQVDIFALNGQKVYAKSFIADQNQLDIKIDLSDFPSGTYLFNLSAAEKFYHAEIILK